MRPILLILVALIYCAFQSSAQAGDDRMGYTLVPDESGEQVLVLWGPIDTKDTQRFLDAARASPNARGFWLASGGGNPMTAMEMGRLIRKTGLPVTVPTKARLTQAVQRKIRADGGASNAVQLAAWLQNQPKVICASACGYLLIGGRLRFVDEQHAVGLHASRNDSALLAILKTQNPDQTYKDLERSMQNAVALKNTYLSEMSVSIGYSEISTAVPAQCMYYLSAREMTALNLTNVNGFQTPGSGAGRCDCWAFEASDSRLPEFNKICAESARSGTAVFSQWKLRPEN